MGEGRGQQWQAALQEQTLCKARLSGLAPISTRRAQWTTPAIKALLAEIPIPWLLILPPPPPPSALIRAPPPLQLPALPFLSPAPIPRASKTCVTPTTACSTRRLLKPLPRARRGAFLGETAPRRFLISAGITASTKISPWFQIPLCLIPLLLRFLV